MNRFLSVICLVLLGTAPAVAREERPDSLLDAALRSARELKAEPPSGTGQAAQDAPDARWANVRSLGAGKSIRITTRDGIRRDASFVSAGADEIVVSVKGVTLLPIPRFDVTEIRRRSAGSLVGGLAGAAVGGFLGFGSAISLALKQCGRSCSDERFLIGASLVGLPILGAVLGAKVIEHGRWKRVY